MRLVVTYCSVNAGESLSSSAWFHGWFLLVLAEGVILEVKNAELIHIFGISLEMLNHLEKL